MTDTLSPVRSHTSAQAARAQRAVVMAWVKFVVLLAVLAVVLAPIVVVLLLAFRPASGAISFYFGNFATVFGPGTLTANWLANSLIVALVTTVMSVVVGSCAGYVLSRARSGFVSAWSLMLFIIQSLPVIIFVVPLFVLFANLGLADSLVGVAIIYVGISMAVACWMMASYMDTIPVALEEAAWIDGSTIFGSFIRIVMRNSLPGVLSTAVFSFLVAWNEYLIAVVFLRTDLHLTLPVGLRFYFQQSQTDWGAVMAISVVMMLPPILVFAIFNRYFSVGGIGGSFAGR